MNKFDGSEKEFETLINAHKAAVYGTAYAYFKYNSEIDDVVQETFIHAYFNYGTIHDKSKIGAWLCGVARNISLKKFRGTRYCLSLDEIEELKCCDIETWFVKRETIGEIHQAIASLSKPVAETVALFYLSGKTVREISALLSVPEGTVKSRLHDGRKQLKGELIYLMKEESVNITKKDVAAEVKNFIVAGNEEVRKGHLSVALTHYDCAIAAIEKENTDYKLLSEIYRLRASAHIGNNDEAIPDGEKSINYAKLTGNKRLIAESLLSYAFDNNEEEATAIFKEAYDSANAVNYHEVCAECAFWLGAYAAKAENYVQAKKHFTDAIAHYSHITVKSTANCCVGDSVRVHSFTSAALKSLKMLDEKGHLNGNYISLNTFCQLIRLNNGSIITDNNYGWDIPGRQTRPGFYHRFFGHFEGMNLIYSNDLLKYGKSDYEYYSGNGVLVKRHYEVVSSNEAVSVEAGNFTGCLHISVTEVIPEYDSSDKEQTFVYEYLDKNEYWFAPNVGEIKASISCPNMKEFENYSYELKHYEATSSVDPIQKYLPLCIGNKWEYVIYDEADKPYSEKYDYRDCYEVDIASDEIVYISNSGYAIIK